ncbi:DUF262 domain-containing protein [Fibrella sp. USSR17]
MKFEIEKWAIHKLIKKYETKSLNLNPPYQRNNIWTAKSQKTLVSSIKDGMPVPTFFIHDKGEDKYDVADGQQRTRAIIAYYSREISDLNGIQFNHEEEFLDYEIPVVIINKSVSQEQIRQFYVTVNNTGLKLNKPELTKAEYFDTGVLRLVEELADNDDFESLGIFTDKQSGRMIDRDFVEELVAQLHFGIGDKKKDVDRLYQSNLSETVLKKLKEDFLIIVKIFKNYPDFKVSTTRYSQRNDFYTLFGFIDTNKNLDSSTYSSYFELLKAIENDISPSNDECKDMQFYALNCVSQSNSKLAREERLRFFKDMLLNTSLKLNKTQKSIINYYKLTNKDVLTTQDGFVIIDPKKVETQFKRQ